MNPTTIELLDTRDHTFGGGIQGEVTYYDGPGVSVVVSLWGEDGEVKLCGASEIHDAYQALGRVVEQLKRTPALKSAVG